MGKLISHLLPVLSLLAFQSCITSKIDFDDRSELSTSSINSYKKSESFILDSESLSDEKLALVEDEVNEELSTTKRDQVVGDFQEYQTKNGETLMLVAFNIYGDYRKWKDLLKLNQDVLSSNTDLSHLPIIRYQKPLLQKSTHEPIGSPYLIKNGDYLSLISKKVYGNPKEWPLIRRNNPDLIRDPNLICTSLDLR